MRSLLCKIGLILATCPVFVWAGPAGPPSGQAILNSPIYQRNSQMWVDTGTFQGILQVPYGASTPPSNECTVSSQTGRIFIVSSTTAGGSRIWVCEGTNGWQVKNSTGGGGSGVPGGTDTQFQYNNSGAFAGSANLTTTASTITATNFLTSTLTVSNLSIFQSVSSTTWQSVSTMTFNDGILVDMSNINDSNIGEGLLIPRASDGCINATRDSDLCWDTTNKLLYVGNGTGITAAMNNSLKVLTSAGVLVSSPTQVINFNKDQFTLAAPTSSSATVALNGSSVTLKGNTFLPIIQVQQYTTATSSSTTSTGFTLTTLSGSITPHSTSNKVLVLGAGNVACTGSGVCYATLERDAVNLASGQGGFETNTAASNNYVNMSYYDSPATTSAVTYSVQIRVNGGGVTASFPGTDGGIYTTTAVLILQEIAQ